MKTLTAVPSGYAIREVDVHDADEQLLDKVVALAHLLDNEAIPEDPPAPEAGIKARLRNRSKFGERIDHLAFRGDELVGRVAVWQNKSGSNEHIRDVMIQVHPDHRRRGLGSALFAAGIDPLPEDGTAKLLSGWTSTRVPAGIAFAERVGAKKGLHMRVSQVDLSAIDRALMRQWASVDPAGYRLEFIDGDVPAALMPAAINALSAINRMPREGLEMEDWTFTEETMRDWERQRKTRGQESWLMLAIDEATGAGIAFTGIAFDRRVPSVIDQGGTAVDQAHQGRDLGKWRKGRMVEKIIAEIPEARFIRTDNAGTNAPMLAINDRMGFREAWWGDVWQIPLEDAKKYAAR